MIDVAAGTYTENLTINKSVTLLGPNSTISPNTGTRVAEAVITPPTNSRAIEIQSSNVTIKGFKITGANLTWGQTAVITAGNSSLGGSTISNNVLIEKMWLDNNKGHGIYTNSEPGTACDKWTITDNRITNTLSNSPSVSFWTGMNLWKMSDLTLTNNVVDGVSDWGGIQLETVAKGTISGNTISNIADNGLQIAFGCYDLTVTNNTISNAGNGVGGRSEYFEADDGGIKIFGMTGTDDPYNISITGNTIIGCKNGIGLRSETNVTGKNNTISDNKITGSVNKAIYHAGTGTLTATCNWFGTAIASEIESKIKGYVDWEPFKTAVDGDCDGTVLVHNTTRGVPYATIQRAINEATSGDEITADAGTYAENLLINKSISLIGPNAAISPITGTRVAEAIITPPTGYNAISIGNNGGTPISNVIIKWHRKSNGICFYRPIICDWQWGRF